MTDAERKATGVDEPLENVDAEIDWHCGKIMAVSIRRDGTGRHETTYRCVPESERILLTDRYVCVGHFPSVGFSDDLYDSYREAESREPGSAVWA